MEKDCYFFQNWNSVPLYHHVSIRSTILDNTSKNSYRPTLYHCYTYLTQLLKELKMPQLAIKSEKGGSHLEKGGRKREQSCWKLKKKGLLHYDKLLLLKSWNRRYGNISSRKRLMRCSFLPRLMSVVLEE